jgi:RNA ligase (TIGR02306 family)
MSTLIVEVCEIEKVLPHENADALELAHIKGWQVVIPKERYAAGDLVTYIPIDSVIPEEHSERWGITKYLSNGRVRCARLRGEPSFGVIVDREDKAWALGLDVAEHYGITKYLPPVKIGAGDAAPAHGLFTEYTDVENLRNFPGVLADGEEVAVTEKIHGTNCRLGLINGEMMAGSMSVRRVRPERLADSIYWQPLAQPGVEALLTELGTGRRQVILYGEVFGSKVQSLNYGQIGSLGFRAFDLLIEGKYVDADEFEKLCKQFDVPTVPALYRGPYSLAKIVELSQGNTILGADHIREGVVVRPAVERIDPKIGRVCLKYIGDQYLFAKGVTDSQDV